MTPGDLVQLLRVPFDGLAPADRLALAVALAVFAGVLIVRMVLGHLAHHRRHGWRHRLDAVRRVYMLGGESAEEAAHGRRKGRRTWRRSEPAGVLARAQRPASLPGRLAFAVRRRIVGAGGARAAGWLAAAAVGAFLCTFAVVAVVVGPGVGAVAGVLAATLAGAALLRLLERRSEQQFLADFPHALDILIRAVRAGLPVSEAIGSIASEMHGPVGAEFQRLRNDLAIGTPLATALGNAATRIHLKEFHFFVVALALQNETGGRLSEILENLSRITRARTDMRAKVQALTADGRTSANVIAALTVVTGVGLLLINPDYMLEFATQPRGKMMFALATAMVVSGVLIIRRMVRIRV